MRRFKQSQRKLRPCCIDAGMRIRFIRLQNSTPAEIEKYVKRYEAEWFIVDQLRNMKIPRAGR